MQFLYIDLVITTSLAITMGYQSRYFAAILTHCGVYIVGDFSFEFLRKLNSIIYYLYCIFNYRTVQYFGD